MIGGDGYGGRDRTGVKTGWKRVGGKGGRRCGRRHVRDAHLLGLVAGSKQRRVSIPIPIVFSVSVQGLVLCQDDRQVLQKGHDVFWNEPVCRRSGSSRALRVLARCRSLITMVVVISWLGELLEKIV